MANHTIKEPREFTEKIRRFETTDKGHANLFNEVIEPLLNNDAYLKQHTDTSDLHIKDEILHVTQEDKERWDNKAEKDLVTSSSDGLMHSSDKIKMDGIDANAEVNQNAISKIKSGANTLEANAKSSLVELISGNKIDVTVDNGTKKITFALREEGIEADTIDGKHAKTTLKTTEKSDLAGAINELLNILTGHTGNGTIHVSATEKSSWDNKAGTAAATQSANGLMAATDKRKLDGIATGANNYTHPSTHSANMITSDATHRFVTDAEKTIWSDKYTKNEVDNKFSQLETAIDWKESVATYANIATTYPNPQDGWTVNVKDTDYTYRYNGSAWVAISANSIPLATASVDGKMSKSDKVKLDGIATNANNYTHPSTHAASMITPDATHRFVTDTEKITWNNKASTATATQTSNGLMSSTDKKKMDGVETGANKYTHPSTHPASMIETDTNRQFVTSTEKNSYSAKLGTNNIANNLTTTSTGKVLDAYQGKVLKDRVDAIGNIKSLKSNTVSVASGVTTTIDSYTFTVSGVYIVFAKMAAHALPVSAYKLSYIIYNGNQYISEDSMQSAGLYRAALGGIVVAESGKKVELKFEHDSGSSYNATGGLQIARIK